MKITKRQLRRIIKEEKYRLLKEFGSEEYGRQTKEFEPISGIDTTSVSGARQAEAVEQIEAILNELFDDGVDNAGLITLLEGIIRDIDRGYVGQPT